MFQILLSSRAMRLQRLHYYFYKIYSESKTKPSLSRETVKAVAALCLVATPILGVAAIASDAAEIDGINGDGNSSKANRNHASQVARNALLNFTGLKYSFCEEKPESRNAQQHSQQQQSPFCLTKYYEIEQVLGEGAYGMVYRARRKLDGLPVALKTMPREFTGKTDFEREVSALKRLSKPNPHAHIVQLYDLHYDDKNYYLVMELIQGGELLEHLIQNGPYSEAVAASFLRQFAEAICHVHAAGLTHAGMYYNFIFFLSSTKNTLFLRVSLTLTS